MRVAHLADLHLGFRQYLRQTPGGINQREADVTATLHRAMAQVIACRPDLVVVAGDVFHTVRPSNTAILDAFRAFSALRDALPDAPVVMVAGNHDAPRTAETGCILQLFREIGVHVADTKAVTFTFPDRDLVVLAVPDVPGIERPAFVPPPDVRHRVLLLHGEIEGMLPEHAAATDRATIEIPVAALHADAWSYVALGHYHVHTAVAPNAWYSGSIDYTSSNPWGELREEFDTHVPGKGFVVHDLVTGAHEFHPVEATRTLVDLPRIDADGLTARDLDIAIARLVAAVDGGIDDRIVRLVVTNAQRSVMRELDATALRDYRARALHFNLDARRPVARLTRDGKDSARAPRRTLTTLVADHLRECVLPGGVDRDTFVLRGMQYLQDAEDAAAAALPVADG